MSNNGCAHTHTHVEEDDDYTYIVCDNCGDVRSKAPKRKS